MFKHGPCNANLGIRLLNQRRAASFGKTQHGTNMDLAEVGQIAREARKKRHLTQDQVAKPLRMGRATLSRLENGIVDEIGIRKVMALCDQLGLELVVRPRVQKILSWDEQLRENNRLKLEALNSARAHPSKG
jgi:transcriptional regulator with XRE-family HTH domain